MMRTTTNLIAQGLAPGRRSLGSGRPSRGPNLLVDGDCEAAGVGAWSVTNASVTKQTTDPAQGLRNLRVTNLTSNGWAQQVVTSTDSTYRITGCARKITASAAVKTGAVTIFQTASESWVCFDEVFVATTTILRFFALGAIADTHAEYDDLYLSLES